MRTLIVEDVMRSVKVNERSNIIGDPGVRDSSAWDKASRKTYWRKNLATICFNMFAKANTVMNSALEHIHNCNCTHALPLFHTVVYVCIANYLSALR